LNRTIEKHAGHIFVVSRTLLAEFLDLVSAFFKGVMETSVRIKWNQVCGLSKLHSW